jgi:DNA polymerase-3 subunit delta
MLPDVDLAAPVILVKGSDEVLLEEAVVELVRALVGDADRSLVVEELDADRYDRDTGFDIAPLVDAAQTPPFLTDRRVVVGRHAGVFTTKDAVAPLVAYLDDPLPSTSLVLVWEKDGRPGKQGRLGALPRSLSDAVKASGGAVLDPSPGTGRAATSWVDDVLRDAPVTLDAGARAAVVAHCGDELSRLPGLLATFAGVYGDGARLGAADVEPYLGEAGDVAPWDLTDAVDAGDVPLALERLHRMLDGGGRHPLQVMATLTNHYLRMLRLDDPTIRGEKAAAEVLGIKGSTFPAKKALAAAQRLGSDRLAQFAELLAQADLDLHGARAWPPELVVEVLVARLAGRSRTRSRR